MFESLFGAGTPLAVRFFIAFLVVFVLIGVTAWLVRRFGTDRLGTQSARGRQPRLAVIDAAAVDGRRRLVLIRRDNIEHLLMIGGPSDVVVETNIVRAAASRESATRAGSTAAATADTLPRAVPLGEAALWPLQPEPVPRAQRRAIAEETVQWPMPAEPGPRNRGSDTLAGLAAELARPAAKSANGGAAASAAPEHAMPEPLDLDAPHDVAETPPPANAADHNLAEMAQRLEAALRHSAAPQAPAAPAETRLAPPAAPKPAGDARLAPKPGPAAGTPREGNGPARTPPKAEPRAEPAKTTFPSLEQEMASLLGRPPSKPG
jgi:flagellar biogenesis protein FliO